MLVGAIALCACATAACSDARDASGVRESDRRARPDGGSDSVAERDSSTADAADASAPAALSCKDLAADATVGDPERYECEDGLPVIHLGVSPNINDDAHEPASFVYRGHTYSGVTAKYRGATSRKFPKRSYTVRFDKADTFVDREHGFQGAQRLVLTTTFDDNSYLRQRLAYELWNRQSSEHVPIHVFNAVVYIDGAYRGLYVASDHIDDDFLEDAGLYGHANLYKARTHDANFRLERDKGGTKPNLHYGYTKQEGTPEDPDPAAFADLDALVEWIATAPDPEFADALDARLVRSEFEDWLMFVCLTQATDSAGKNSYLYHDARDGAPESRWRYLPWDFNASMGQGYRTQRRDVTAYPLPDFARYNELFARILRDETLFAHVRERFRDALSGPWSRDIVLALWDAYRDEIAAAAARDESEWGETYRTFWSGRADLTTHAEEVDYVRRWIEGRWAFLAGSL